MKFEIIGGLGSEQVVRRLPVQYQARSHLRSLHGIQYHLILFGGPNDDVVVSGVVKRALEHLPPEAAELVAAGAGFTAEALELLRGRGAVIYTLGDFHWTDASFQSVRQATRLPRDGA